VTGSHAMNESNASFIACSRQIGTGPTRSLFHHFDIGPAPFRERERIRSGVCDTSQGADFGGGRTVPGFAKIIMLLQTLVIVLLSFWVVEEYLNNIYFEAYVNNVIQVEGSLISILVIIAGLGMALGLFKVLRSTHREIGALVNQPQAPISGPVRSSSMPGLDLHPMVAALKAEMAHTASMEPLPPVDLKEASQPVPVQGPPGPPPTKTLAVVPTTVITGTMPVLKRVNSEQDKSQGSHQ
jgi:hypothetical protein